MTIKTAYKISYLASAAAVVFGVHLSAQAVSRLDRKSPAIRTCVLLPKLWARLRAAQQTNSLTCKDSVWHFVTII